MRAASRSARTSGCRRREWSGLKAGDLPRIKRHHDIPDQRRGDPRFWGEAGILHPFPASISNTSQPEGRHKADLVFVGSIDWMANIDGARWFVREALPLIQNIQPMHAGAGRTQALRGTRRPGAHQMQGLPSPAPYRISGPGCGRPRCPSFRCAWAEARGSRLRGDGRARTGCVHQHRR